MSNRWLAIVYVWLAIERCMPAHICCDAPVLRTFFFACRAVLHARLHSTEHVSHRRHHLWAVPWHRESMVRSSSRHHHVSFLSFPFLSFHFRFDAVSMQLHTVPFFVTTWCLPILTKRHNYPCDATIAHAMPQQGIPYNPLSPNQQCQHTKHKTHNPKLRVWRIQARRREGIFHQHERRPSCKGGWRGAWR